jgi:hypothetical protein
MAGASGLAQDELAVAATAAGASFASLLGVTFVLCSWVCAAGPRVYYLKLVTFLALANFITAFGYGLSLRRLLPSAASQPELKAFTSDGIGFTANASRLRADGGVSGAEDALCGLQAWLVTAGELSSLLWTLTMALALHAQVVRKATATKHTERLSHAVCWGVPAAVSFFLLFSHSLGQPTPADREWCWVHTSPSPTSVSLQLLAFDLPVVACLGACLVCYTRVANAFRALNREGAVDAPGRAAIHARLRVYVGVFIACWTPALVHRVWRLAATGGGEVSLEDNAAGGAAWDEGSAAGGWGGINGGSRCSGGDGDDGGGASGDTFTASRGGGGVPFGLRIAHAATAPLVRGSMKPAAQDLATNKRGNKRRRVSKRGAIAPLKPLLRKRTPLRAGQMYAH